MRRREFVTLVAGAAAWPFAARAQQSERIRRIGIILPAAAEDSEFRPRLSAFLQRMQDLGWSIGRNLQIETHWATTNASEIGRHAAELVALAPDIILANGSSVVG